VSRKTEYLKWEFPGKVLFSGIGAGKAGSSCTHEYAYCLHSETFSADAESGKKSPGKPGNFYGSHSYRFLSDIAKKRG